MKATFAIIDPHTSLAAEDTERSRRDMMLPTSRCCFCCCCCTPLPAPKRLRGSICDDHADDDGTVEEEEDDDGDDAVVVVSGMDHTCGHACVCATWSVYAVPSVTLARINAKVCNVRGNTGDDNNGSLFWCCVEGDGFDAHDNNEAAAAAADAIVVVVVVVGGGVEASCLGSVLALVTGEAISPRAFSTAGGSFVHEMYPNPGGASGGMINELERSEEDDDEEREEEEERVMDVST